jgi:hypothetical protein
MLPMLREVERNVGMLLASMSAVPALAASGGSFRRSPVLTGRSIPLSAGIWAQKERAYGAEAR